MAPKVELVPHSCQWAAAAAAESARIMSALGSNVVTVHHIGSTAISGICAKPVLDLLPEVVSLARLDQDQPRLQALGYEWWYEYGIANRRYCTLDDAKSGRRSVQLHCFQTGNPEIERHLAFRDYLRANPQKSKEYEAEKQRCRKLHPEDSHAYSVAKSDWIAAQIPLALAYYRLQMDSKNRINCAGEEAVLACALGGPGWTPRTYEHRDEIGTLWRHCGVKNEWKPLRQVILHRPGDELLGITDPNSAQMLQALEPGRAQEQHDNLAEAFRKEGIQVHFIAPAELPPPNLMFVADLFFMTPEGAILARPASTVRAGEERWVAGRLAELGIPILRTLRGSAHFEGADAAWMDSSHVLIGTGFRTNAEGARQVAAVLAEIGVDTTQVEIPRGAMHLMGMLRFLDSDLAITRSDMAPPDVISTLKRRGFRVLSMRDSQETTHGMSLNFVTLGAKRILMPGGNNATQDFLEREGVSCRTVIIDELLKAAGGIGCLTGIIERGCP